MLAAFTQGAPRSYRCQHQNNIQYSRSSVCVVVIGAVGVAVAEPFNGRTLSGLVKERHRRVVCKFGPSDQGGTPQTTDKQQIPGLETTVAWCASVKRGDTGQRSHPGGDLQRIDPIVQWSGLKGPSPVRLGWRSSPSLSFSSSNSDLTGLASSRMTLFARGPTCTFNSMCLVSSAPQSAGHH